MRSGILTIESGTLTVRSVVYFRSKPYAVRATGRFFLNLIYHSDIYDIQSARYLLKTDCKKMNKDGRNILVSACGYLLTEDNDKKEELSWAIDRNNNATISLITLAVVLLIVGILSFVLTAQYYQVNNKFYEFKFGMHTQ